MKFTHRSIAVVLSILVLSAAGSYGQDWPQWRGQNRDGKVIGFTAPQKWPAALTEKWKVTVGTGDSTPALVGDKLYVFGRQGDEEVLTCLGAADGKKLWPQEYKYQAQAVSGAASRHPGPRGSPAVADGKVVVLGAGGILSCVDAATGKELWKKDEFPKVVPQFFTGMSPIIVDGMAIAHLGGKGNGAVIAYDLATGKEKWRWAGEGPAYDSPVLMTLDGTKAIVTLTEKSLVGLAAADGKVLFQTPAQPGGRVYNSATPIVDGQTVIYTGQGQGTRAVKIEKAGDKYEVKEVWANKELGTGFNTPVLKDGLLYGLSDKSTFFCIDAKTGKTAWSDANRRKNFGAIVDAGQVLVALPEDGELTVLKPGEKAYEEVAKIKVSSDPIYAHPVLAGNKIYIKGKDTLAMYTME